ncbi:hypothetical protein ACFQ0B_06975 [Nonomuraea thailandensis]
MPPRRAARQTSTRSSDASRGSCSDSRATTSAASGPRSSRALARRGCTPASAIRRPRSVTRARSPSEGERVTAPSTSRVRRAADRAAGGGGSSRARPDASGAPQQAAWSAKPVRSASAISGRAWSARRSWSAAVQQR